AVHRRLRFGEERRAVAARAGVARPARHLASLKSQRHRPYFIQTSILWMNMDNRYNLSALNHPTKRNPTDRDTKKRLEEACPARSLRAHRRAGKSRRL